MPSSVERPPCRACTRPTKRPSGLCLECDPAPSTAKRPERACTGCGKRTTAQDQTCKACQPTYMTQGPIEYAHAVYADTPGRWVQDGLVQRWQSSQVA